MARALIVENVGKAYVRYRSELQRFARWFGLRIGNPEEKWVLRHIGFRIERGESVAIIGQNGAGKSTLLKMITGTVKPTEGNIRVDGRVSALLELGLGFNSELSGRENVIHAAGMQGLSSAQIQSLLPEIEAFAEVGEYFDQPMRVYSSGMQMRVAFSVATAVRPDILIVDEALSVGDSYFVHKSFQRIKEFKQAGTTLLFVSHDPGAVRSLCDRAILLDAGRMVHEGEPSEVLDFYNALIAERETKTITVQRDASGAALTSSGTGEVEFINLQLLDERGGPVESVRVGQSLTLKARVRAQSEVRHLAFGFMIRDRLGQPVFGTNTAHLEQTCELLGAGAEMLFTCQLPANIGPGSYSISVALHQNDNHLQKNFQWKDLALMFNVVNLDHPLFVGTAWLPVRIQIEQTQSAISRAE